MKFTFQNVIGVVVVQISDQNVTTQSGNGYPSRIHYIGEVNSPYYNYNMCNKPRKKLSGDQQQHTGAVTGISGQTDVEKTRNDNDRITVTGCFSWETKGYNITDVIQCNK